MSAGRDFWLVFLSNFLFFASFYMLLPVMPLYVLTLGGHEAAVGLVMACFTISSVVARPFVGRYVDRKGCRAMMGAGAALFVASPLLYLASDEIGTLFLLRLLHGLGLAFFGVGSVTLISQMAPRDARGEALGLFTVSTIVAMAIFPWVGDALAARSYASAFVFSSLLASASLLLALPARDLVGKSEEGFVFNGFLFLPTFAIFCAAFSYGGIVSFLPLMTDSPGFFYFVYAVSVIVSRLTLVRLSDTVGRRKVILPSLLLTSAGMLLLAGGSMWHVTVAAIVYGIGFGAAYPTLSALIIDRIEKKGEALSIFTAAFDGGIACGSLVLGLVAQWHGFSVMIVAASCVVFSGTIIFLVASRGWGEERL